MSNGDSILDKFIQRWAFMAQAAILIGVLLWGLWTIYQFPFYVYRWYQADEPKESRFYGWRCVSQMFGIYAYCLVVATCIWDVVARSWPTLWSLLLDDAYALQPNHEFGIFCDCVMFGLIACFISRRADKLGFIEEDPETGKMIFYRGLNQ